MPRGLKAKMLYNFIPSLFHAFMPSISLIFLHIFIDIIALIGEFGHLAVT